MNKHEVYVRQVNELASLSRKNANKPFGALLERNGSVLLTAENSQLTNSPLGHAELNVLMEAWRTLTPAQIAESTIYASTEPCPMCAGAIYWSGIRRVVFSVSRLKFSEFGGSELCEPCSKVLNVGPQKVEIIGPVLESEGLIPHEGFWKAM